ncbi:hypothetical protein D3C78_731060 [compost metagenome]
MGLGRKARRQRFAIAAFRRRGELQLLVDAAGKGVERTHLHLQAAGNRLQCLAAQLRQVGVAGHLVNRLAVVQAGAQLQRYTLLAMGLDRGHLPAQHFQAFTGSQQLCAVIGAFDLGQLATQAVQPLAVVGER